MRKYLLTSVLLLCLSTTVMAQHIHSVHVNVELRNDGSAIITQDWDATVVKGTEWYIPIDNLDKMYVDSLTVFENGKRYISEGDKWDVDRTLGEKIGRCGIVRKSRKSVELCWGQGSYKRHQWKARFIVTGLVQSLKDYDAFNFMFINPGLVAPPDTASVVIENHADTTLWTPENTKVWAFGFYGDIHVEDGKIVAKTSKKMVRESKMILMVRFDKGMFSPSVSRNQSFEKMYNKALKGSDYTDGDSGSGSSNGFFSGWSWDEILSCIFCILLLIVYPILMLIANVLGYKYSKNLFKTYKITGWWRNVPLDGNLFATFYVLKKGDLFIEGDMQTHKIVGALFLKWILDGVIKAEPDEKNNKVVNLSFKADPSEVEMSKAERDLYNMAREACGDNLILEEGEFNKWSKKKYSKITKWPKEAEEEGLDYLKSKGYLDEKARYSTEEGAEEMRHVIELKNFLKDFTKIEERTVMETILWKEYLVFAQMFGIADKVSQQLSKLYPAEMAQFSKSVGTDMDTFMRTISYNNSMTSSAVLRAISEASSKERSSSSGRSFGDGGSSSFGGGGGFSGGGSGGGSR